MKESERIRRAHERGLRAFKKLSKAEQLKRLEAIGIIDASGALTPRYGGKRKKVKPLKLPPPPTKAEQQAYFDSQENLDGGIGPHRHRWDDFAYSGRSISFCCRVEKNGKRCQARYSRFMTKEEKKVRGHSAREMFHRPVQTNVHRVWHDFRKRFLPDDSWVYVGYALMTRVDKWAERFPKDVQVLSCDDHAHAGSSLVIIEHKAPRRYMGTTVVFIPQCTGENPICFFLYPEHRKAFVKALQSLDGPMRKSQRAQNDDRRREEEAWKKVLQIPTLKWAPRP